MRVRYAKLEDVIKKGDFFNEKVAKEWMDTITNVVIEFAKHISDYIDVAESNTSDDTGIIINLSDDLLAQTIIDAIVDLRRISNLHRVKKPNLIKIAAYLGYWFVRRKPVQIIGDIEYIQPTSELRKNNKIEINKKLNQIKTNLQFVNEIIAVRFMMATFLDFSKDDSCSDSQKRDWNAVIEYANYYMAYRAESPNPASESCIKKLFCQSGNLSVWIPFGTLS